MPTTADQLTELIHAMDLDGIRAALDAQPELINQPESRIGWTPLHWAAYHGYNSRGKHLKPVVELLLEYAGTVDLHTAALLDDPGLAKAAIDAGAEVDALNDRGQTALHLAGERGSVAVAEVLLDHGADPNARSERGDTPLALAAHPGPLKEGEARDVVDLLRERGATVDVYTAAMLGDAATLGRLLDDAPELLNAIDDGGCTPLYHAAHNLRLAAVDLLLNRGADVDLVGEGGQSPLSTAVDHSWDVGGKEVVARLLEADPVVDLFSAGQLGLTDRLNELLDDDPAAAESTSSGYSLLFLTCGAGHADAAAAILQHGADPNRTDPYHGSTALHQAAAWGAPEACRVLLEGGVDKAIRDQSGQTAAEVAQARGRAELAEFIDGWAAQSSSSSQ